MGTVTPLCIWMTCNLLYKIYENLASPRTKATAHTIFEYAPARAASQMDFFTEDSWSHSHCTVAVVSRCLNNCTSWCRSHEHARCHCHAQGLVVGDDKPSKPRSLRSQSKHVLRKAYSSGRLAVKGPRKPDSGWKTSNESQMSQCAFVALTREESLLFRPIS